MDTQDRYEQQERKPPSWLPLLPSPKVAAKSSLPIVGARPGAGCSHLQPLENLQTRGHTLNFTDCRLTAAGLSCIYLKILKK